MHIDQALRDAATENHELITRAAWVDLGRDPRAFDRAIRAGLLVRIDRGVAVLSGTEITPERRIHAAVIATRHACIVSHRSAAFVWGAPVSGVDPVELLSTDRTGWTRRSGVVVHRPTDRFRTHAVLERGFRVTAPLRTLVDVGASAPEAVGPTLLAMLIRGVATVAGARQAAARHGRRGRPGVPALRQALDELPLGTKPPDSVLEPMMAGLFLGAGIHGWTFHPKVRGYELDFAFAAQRVDVEVDGWRWHRSSFERDRERDAVLTAAGWVVLRFTWRQVTRRPDWVVGTVARTLAERSRPR